jgi:osmotically-inducible protein OsmY
MFKKSLVPFLVLLLALASHVTAEDKETFRDDIIAAGVNRTLDYHVFYTSFDYVTYGVNDGVVTLSGFVTHPYKNDSFANAIMKSVEGVKRVENKLVVLPPSHFDDELRYTIAAKIYNDGRLLRYAINTYRLPIHIIVKNGHVSLEGAVDNEMDRKLIESDVRGIIGVVSVSNNLKLAE